MIIGGGSVTGAMYCQVQFYMQLKDSLMEHKPFRKITAVKLLILLSFWQTVQYPVRTVEVRKLTLFLANPIGSQVFPYNQADRSPWAVGHQIRDPFISNLLRDGDF